MELTTKLGKLDGVVVPEYYSDGTLKSCILQEKNLIFTEIGALVPRYGEETPRRKYTPSVSFYESGAIKSVNLEVQGDVMTPIGEFPAELVTFYESGELKRIFPVNGKISGFWSEKDEAELNIPFTFDFEFGEFSSKLIGICFYQTGDIRSITLYPDEVITLTTKVGEIPVRIGFSLYESGKLKSIEPNQGIVVATPIGDITAFDINALGINADTNSLCFSENGSVISMITTSDKIAIQKNNGVMRFITPIQKPSQVDEDEIITIPIKLDFLGDTVIITCEEEESFSINECKFNIIKGESNCSSSCTDCSSCSLCK